MEREVGPMPSLTMKIRLRFGDDDGEVIGEDVCWRCWKTTASTMTATVARKAQAKRTISRRRTDHRREVDGCRAASSASAAWSESRERRRGSARRGVREVGACMNIPG
jgi:hypothetical protein